MECSQLDGVWAEGNPGECNMIRYRIYRGLLAHVQIRERWHAYHRVGQAHSRNDQLRLIAAFHWMASQLAARLAKLEAR